MNRPIRALSAIFVFLLLPFGLFAQVQSLPSLDEVLPALSEDDRNILMTDGELLRFHGEGVSPGLLPETGLTSAVARQIIAGNMNIGIEGLFFTPLDELPSGFSETLPGERELILYNIMRSVSTLQGLEYYSASRDEMRLLFEESWAVEDEDSKEPLPDPLVSAIPAEDSIYVHQKDKSFGKNKQHMSFRFTAMQSLRISSTPHPCDIKV